MKRVYIFCFLLICALLVSSCANRSFKDSSYNRQEYVQNKEVPAVKEEEVEHFLHSLQGLEFIAPRVIKKSKSNSCKVYIARKFNNKLIKRLENRPYHYFEYHVIADNNKDIVFSVKLSPNSYTIGYLDAESCEKGFYDFYGKTIFNYKSKHIFSNIFMESGVKVSPVGGFSRFSSVATDNVISYSFEGEVKPLDGLCINSGCKISIEEYVSIISTYLEKNNSQ